VVGAATATYRTWFWSIHGVFGKPTDMRGHGVAPTLEGAQADLEEQWQKWLRWANLKERARRVSPASAGHFLFGAAE
jgi:hypothetical protein